MSSAGRTSVKATAKPSAETPAKKAAKPKLGPPVSPIEHIAFQLVNPPLSETEEEDDANAAASKAVSNETSYGIIIEDDLPLGEGQVRRTVFMDQLASLIES